MLSLLKERPEFRRLWMGDVISLLGDWLSFVAVSLLALERGSTLLAVAMVLVAHALPTALLAPFSGWVTDRFDRKRLLVGASTLRGVVALSMAGAAYADSLVAVEALLLLRVALGAFVEPAAVAALPRLVKEDEIGKANALMAATWSLLFAVGVALGGVLATLVGPTLAILADACTFFVAAIVLGGLPTMRPERTDASATAWSGVREAWRFARQRAPVLRAALGKTPVSIANGGAWVLLTVLGKELGWLGSTAMAIGTLHFLRAIGTGIGPVAWTRLATGKSERPGWHIAAALTFLSMAVLAMTRSTPLVAICLVLWGAGMGANWVAAVTRLQRATPDGLRGRLSSLDLFGYTLGECIGALCGAALAEWAGSAAVSAWFGVVAGLATWILLHVVTKERSQGTVATTGSVRTPV